jgi:hypothetical protein
MRRTNWAATRARWSEFPRGKTLYEQAHSSDWGAPPAVPQGFDDDESGPFATQHRLDEILAFYRKQCAPAAPAVPVAGPARLDQYRASHPARRDHPHHPQ